MNEFTKLPSRAASQLQEAGDAESTLEDFFENGAVALHIVSGEGIILRANRAELDMLGYSAEEYVGRHVGDFHTDPERVADILTRLARGERLERYPARLRAKDGSLRHVLITSSANIRAGRFVNTRCFMVDVTAEIEARAAAESDERFRQLLEALPAAVYMTDREGIITYFNRAAMELAGRAPKIGSDKWCVGWRLYDGKGRRLPLDRCPMAVALKSGEPVRGVEITAERPDGARVPVMPFPTPLKDSSGAVIGAVNMLVDISELKAAKEAALMRLGEQAALFQFTDRLYRARSSKAVYDAALQAIIKALRCDRASILLFDDEGVMRFVAWRGLSELYRTAVEGHTPWRPGERSPQPICIRDVESADLPADLKSVVAAEGIRALFFIPLTLAGRTIGKFMAYRNTPVGFTDGEMSLALTIARQLGFSIERFRAEEQRHRAEAALREHEAQLRFVTDHVPVMLVHCDAETRYLFVNEPYAKRFGVRAKKLVGRTIGEFLGADAYALLQPHVEAALRGERIEFEALVPYQGIGERWVHARYAPQRDAGERVTGFVGVIEDITERKEAEAALRRTEEALHEQQDLTRVITENATTAIFMMDGESRCTFMNPAAERMMGYTFTELRGRIIHDFIHHHHPDGRPYPASDCPIDRALPDQVDVVDHEDVFIRKNGEYFPVLVNARPITKFGAAAGTVVEVRDLTEQKRSEEQRAVLIHELNHRVKNTLATVQSMAMQTLRNTEKSVDARDVFEARLSALSGAHDLLTYQNWGHASLRDIVCRTVEPFQTQSRRILLEGPEIRVSPKQALALSMALHELATNAAKYGSLSNETGSVQVAWKRAGSNKSRVLRLTWQEEGGPPVSPPSHRGFGSRMIERHLALELGGQVVLDYRQQGIVCSISSPVGWGSARPGGIKGIGG